MKYNKKLKKPSKLLKEDAANDADEPKLYMNTWKNYNINGADTDSITGGWMNIEQAKEFLEVHNEEEPFINDTDNVPLEVDEYSKVTVKKVANGKIIIEDTKFPYIIGIKYNCFIANSAPCSIKSFKKNFVIRNFNFCFRSIKFFKSIPNNC